MEVGLYGKLPTHGDFLRRRVADDFVAAWDPWLQHCIADSRAALGEGWLDLYLTSPVWRFAMPANACGAAAVAGLMVPSIDRVGRYFPLTLVWRTPAELSTLEVALRFQQGFERAEHLLLETLEAEQFEFADFDRRVMELSALFEDTPLADDLPLTADSARSFAASQIRARCVPLRCAAALQTPALQIYGYLLDASGSGGCWWTDGSAAVEPCWLTTPGLPESTHYRAMLDGEWQRAGWQHGDTVHAADQAMSETVVRPSADSLLASAALSDRGAVRSNNQDSFIERPDLSVWAVADGMGGLSEGEVASRMVCDALADMPQTVDLEAQIEAAIDALRAVNGYLRRNATRAVNPVTSGTTVVLLLARQGRCAIVWAGDSRAYRLRAGQLTQLTVDHSWAAGEAADNDAESQAITRAVGGEDDFLPDVHRDEMRGGDRLLLCSDGVYRVLDAAMLTQSLVKGTPQACCAELIGEVLAKGGSDNATTVVIDCRADGLGLAESLNIVSL